MEELLRLNLDEENKIGYTLKCMGSGLWGVCSGRDFKTTLNALIKQGGDGDTNGAVCGGMYGARYGYSSLPRAWLCCLPHKSWLDNKVLAFLLLFKQEVSPYLAAPTDT